MKNFLIFLVYSLCLLFLINTQENDYNSLLYKLQELTFEDIPYSNFASILWYYLVINKGYKQKHGGKRTRTIDLIM